MKITKYEAKLKIISLDGQMMEQLLAQIVN